MKAVELFIHYDLSACDTISELGCPDFKTLQTWYEQYMEEQKNGIPWESKMIEYSRAQKECVVDYYLEHGRSLARTVRKLGYPSQE